MSGQTGNISGGTLAEQVKGVLTKTPAASTSTFNTTGVDRLAYNVVEWQILIGAVSGTSPTLDLKVQDSDDNSTFADLASSTQQVGAADANVFRVTDTAQRTAADANTLVTFQTDLRKARRYVRLVGTIGGTTPSFLVGIEALLGGNVEGYKV